MSSHFVTLKFSRRLFVVDACVKLKKQYRFDAFRNIVCELEKKKCYVLKNQ